MAKKKKASTIVFEGSDKPKASKDRHYVDNKMMYQAFVEWNEELKRYEAGEIESEPPIPDYICECFLKIAQQLATKYNFHGNKHYWDEMIGDAVIKCISVAKKFDPAEPKKNPFSYFTQTCYYEFLKRIDIEKTSTYIRLKSAQMAAMDGDLADFRSTESTNEEMFKNLGVTPEYVEKYTSEFELKKKIKKKKQSKASVDSVFYGKST